MKNKKNVAIITSCLTRGGAERAAGLLSSYLSKYYNIYIFLLEKKKITYTYSGEIIQIDFEEKYKKYLGNGNIIGKIKSKFAYFYAVKRIKEEKKKYKIDVAISFLDTINILNLLSKTKEKVVLSVRNNKSLQNYTRIQKFENFCIKHLYNKSDKIVSVSYGVTHDLINNFNIKEEKIETIYNFYDINSIIRKSNYETHDKIMNIFDGKKVIISMGRLTRQKNFSGLISSFKLVNEKFPDTILVIMGSGDLKNELIDQINELKLHKKAYIIDYQNNPYPFIKKSSLFVMNSNFEGICNSIIETFACRTLVLSTDCFSGPREIIDDNNNYDKLIKNTKMCSKGFLTPVNNINEMANSIEKALLLSNEQRDRIINNAFSFVNSYSNEELEKKWINIIGGIT